MGARANPQREVSHDLGLPDRYEVRRHIASGGMGAVWCAEDLLLGRTVAIKVLAERFAYDEFAVRRFKREARAAARVSAHPHVVTIYDVGEAAPTGNGDPDARVGPAFIVMEYLAGGTVADALRVDAVKRQEALRWLREAASALDHAHAQGVVHRDIKPANFLLDQDRRLHVADFGIARLVSEDTLTSSGELFGTAAYLSPEQALGRPGTAASDRYALAVAAFELLVGRRPFTAEHFAAQTRQHIEDEPPRASDRNRAIPEAVDPVLERGMAKEPDQRYATAAAFVEALETALSERLETALSERIAPRGRGGVAGAAASTRVLAPGQAGRSRTARPARAAPATPARAAVASPPTRPRSSSPLRRASASSPSGRRSGRVVALAALAAAVLGVILLAGLGQGGSPTRTGARARKVARPVAGVAHSPRTKPRTTTPAAASATTATVQTSTTPAANQGSTTASASPPTATALEAQGHQLMLNGQYAHALQVLRQAVQTADPQSLTYAYALYDLGRSLVLSGNPSAAVPILERRLQIPNQTPVVQQMLDVALRASGASAPDSGPAPSGGAGLPRGRDHHRRRGDRGPAA